MPVSAYYPMFSPEANTCSVMNVGAHFLSDRKLKRREVVKFIVQRKPHLIIDLPVCLFLVI